MKTLTSIPWGWLAILGLGAFVAYRVNQAAIDAKAARVQVDSISSSITNMAAVVGQLRKVTGLLG